MGLITTTGAPLLAKAAEGEYRPGPYALRDGWLSANAGQYWNFWQMGYDVQPYSSCSAMVEACVSAYAQTIAMCPGDHWRLLPNGGRERQTTATSALARILRSPNSYQTISDFLLNLTRSLYLDGNAYALAFRNNRDEVSELHLMNSGDCAARVAADGSIFYSLGGNEIVEAMVPRDMLDGVPARHVLHVRLNTPRHPLKGESPMMAAALAIAAGNTALRQQIDFFTNQSKWSIVLSTDAVMTTEQRDQLRAAWNAQTTGANAGGVPIVTAGLKPLQVSSSAQDAQLAETMNKSDQDIALAFGVPLARLGMGGAIQSSTEQLMQQWIASGLGFALNHVELAFDQLFKLRGVPEEYTEYSTKSLLRSAYKDRIDGLVKGVQGGVYSSDEARAEEELPVTPGGYGKEPRVQQQVVPLSAWEKGREALAAAPPSPALPAPAAAEEDEAEDAERFAPDAIRRRIDARARPLH